MSRSIRVPRFEHFQHSHGHFDENAAPRWLMVRKDDSARVLLVNGDDLTVKCNEHIAILEPKHMAARGRVLAIKGRNRGRTFVEVFMPDGTRLPLRLGVDVTESVALNIAFTYAEKDVDGNKSNRDVNMSNVLLNTLNDIFGFQANINFTLSTSNEHLQVATSLAQIARENVIGPSDRRNPRKEFETLSNLGDAGAEINVFFLPHLPSQNTYGFDRKAFANNRSDVLLFPDGMSDDQVKVALPHWVAVNRGCSAISNEWMKHYLMYVTRADGDGVDLSSINLVPVIPRDCSRTMNPA